MHSILTGILIGVLLILAGVMTVLRTVFTAVTLEDLQVQRAREKNVQVFLFLIKRQDRVISSLVSGYVLFVVAFIMTATLFLFAGLSAAELLLHVILLPCFIYLLTVAMPKNYAVQQSSNVMVSMAPWIQLAYYLFAIPAWLVTQFYWQAARLLKARTAFPLIYNTREHAMLAARVTEAVIDPMESLKDNMRAFSNLAVQHVMLPVAQIQRIDGSVAIEEMVDKVLNSHAGRIPLYQDDENNIIGILHTRLFLKAIGLAEGDMNAIDLSSAMSEPWFVAPGTPVMEQIRAFTDRGEHYALVRDMQGQVMGAVSFENMLEKLAERLRA